MDFIQTYTELRAIKKPGLREQLRGVVLDAAAFYSYFTGEKEELLKKPRVQFLYIHHVFKDEEEALDRLLKKLSEHHSFISHSEAVQRVLNGQIDRPYISISSDDGLKNNLRAAAIMNRYNAKACFFICPAIIGENEDKNIRTFAENRLHFPPVEFMNWEDVNILQKQGHEIGGHTMNHVNLASISENQQWEEISGCYEVIKRYSGKASHFAYPYGRFFHFSEEGRKKVFKAGFTSCISAERGCHIRDGYYPLDHEHVLFRRDHIVLAWPLHHVEYFLMRNAKQADRSNNYFKFR